MSKNKIQVPRKIVVMEYHSINLDNANHCNNCAIDLQKEIAQLRSQVKELQAQFSSLEGELFNVQQNLEECESGYDATLSLERAKIHDLQEKNMKLQVENKERRIHNEYLEKILDSVYERYDDFREHCIPISCIDSEKLQSLLKVFPRCDDLECSLCPFQIVERKGDF